VATEDLEKKLRLREKRYEVEQLMREKRSEELESLEEVFDKSTLMLLYKILNQGYLSQIHGCIKAGKESRVYWGKDSEDRDVAVKIYLKASSEFRKGRRIYLEGDPRFQRPKRGTRSLVYLWAQKEFRNLQAAHSARVSVPKPILVRGNILLMQFIGEEGVPAPLLKDLRRVPVALYERLLRNIRLLYQKAGLVHGDLSEYNVMVWKRRPVVIDMSQTVAVDHPLSDVFLKRDLANLNNYFLKHSVETRPIDNLETWVKSENAD
jgi:RIO kinase 1